MRHDGDSGGTGTAANATAPGSGGRATSAPPSTAGRARAGTTTRAQLPYVAVELGYRQLLFPHLAANERPPVVYFGIVERFTSLHQYRRRFLIVSATGTLYLCDPAKGNVTHTLSLRDGRTLELEADGANHASGMRAMALYRMGSDEDPLVMVFDCRDGDKCGPFFAVLRHFLGSRERLRVTVSDDVVASMMAHPRRSLFSRIRDRVINAGVASHSTSDAALNGVRDTARTARGQRLRLTDPSASSHHQQQQRNGLAAPTTTTAAPQAAAADGQRDDLRRRVERMYRAKCPERLPVMESALAKYAGHEEELLEAMVAKYGAEPSASASSTPTPPSGTDRGGGGGGDEGGVPSSSTGGQRRGGPQGRLIDGPVPATSVGRPRGNTSFDADLRAHIDTPPPPSSSSTGADRRQQRHRSTTIAARGPPVREGNGRGASGASDDAARFLFGSTDEDAAAGGSAAVSEEEAGRLLAHHQSLADRCAALEAECAALEADATATRSATVALAGERHQQERERRLGDVMAQETALAVLVSSICGRRLREECNKVHRADRRAAEAEEAAARERLADMLDSI